jgi:DNA gyrase inhibitor GyrI
MSELKVRILHLEPMRVACAHGFGQSPEEQAWRTLLNWAESRGLLDDRQAVRFFGFNNPDPSPGSPNYGYDQWMTVGPDVAAEGEIKIVEFPGGLYAVTRCEGLDNIGQVWQQLVTWYEESPYKKAHHQWLEEYLSPLSPLDTPLQECVFDLYLPIAK